MDTTYVTVAIRNPANPERSWEALFLIKPGEMDSVVPRQHLEAIGLQPKGRRLYELADGDEIAVDATVADIEIMGETVGGTVLYGESDSQPSLGMTALASIGIEVDPVSQRLKRRPAVRLKGIPAAAPHTRTGVERGSLS